LAYLKIFSIKDDLLMTFTSGLVTFSGAVTWDVSALAYANAFDDFTHIAYAALIGI
jgi:hypothetical protein